MCCQDSSGPYRKDSIQRVVLYNFPHDVDVMQAFLEKNKVIKALDSKIKELIAVHFSRLQSINNLKIENELRIALKDKDIKNLDFETMTMAMKRIAGKYKESLHPALCVLL